MPAYTNEPEYVRTCIKGNTTKVICITISGTVISHEVDNTKTVSKKQRKSLSEIRMMNRMSKMDRLAYVQEKFAATMLPATFKKKGVYSKGAF